MSRPPSVTYLRDPDLGFEIQLCRGEPHARHRHFHPERALAFIRGGTSRTVLGETEHLLEPGTLVHFPPGVSHSCDPPNPAAWSYDMLFLRVPEEPLPFGGPGAVLLPREERRTLGRLFRDLGSPRLPRGEREHRCDSGRDERRSTMQSLLEEGFAEGLTFEDMANPNLAQAALGLKGLTNLSEWDDFLTEQFRKANRSGTPAGSSTTYRTKAELEGGS